MAGNTVDAESHFQRAGFLALRFAAVSAHHLWATGRDMAAQRLVEKAIDASDRYSWNDNTDIARLRTVLARLDMDSGRLDGARVNATKAITIMHDGDLLGELPEALAVMAAIECRAGELESARRYADKALAITVPRGLVPAQAGALAVRASIMA